MKVDGGCNAGAETKALFSDVDGDGVEETNLNLGMGVGLGLGVSVSSEIPATVADWFGIDMGSVDLW